MYTEIITRAGKHLFKVCPMVPGAVFGEESGGDVRIGRNQYFTKVSKMGQVVLVGRQPESNCTTNGGSGGR